MYLVQFETNRLIIHLLLFKLAAMSVTIDGEYVMLKVKSNAQSKGNFYEYKCTFDFEVQCFWQNNNKTISTTPYEYVDQNHSNRTKDCTIRAKHSNSTITFNKQNPDLYCIGIAHIIKHPYRCGMNVLLECKSSYAVNCAWKRRGNSIRINGIYKYVNANAISQKVTDCSLVINNISAYEEGVWECSRKTTDSQVPNDVYSLDFYNIRILKPCNFVWKAKTTIVPNTTVVTTSSSIITTTMKINTTTAPTMTITLSKMIKDEKSSKGLSPLIIIISSVLTVVVVIGIGLTIIIAGKCRRNGNDALYFTSTTSNVSSDSERRSNSVYSASEAPNIMPNASRPQSSHYLEPINRRSCHDVTVVDGVPHIYEEIQSR
ncbi:hypothetical protein CHUAL_003284 [Chamberlinius hualienensis]